MMKLRLKESDSFVSERLLVTKNEIPCLDSSWHYHPQYELLYISQSNGIRFVGDSVSRFSPGELVLVGPYLPHLWRNDASYYKEGEKNKVKTIVLKFTKDFIGDNTFNNPEFAEINHLLEISKFGVSFGRAVSKSLDKELNRIVELAPAEQAITLLSIIHKLSLSNEKVLLSSSDMRQFTTENTQRIDKVLKYISDNYASDISLNDVSDIACMTPNSFCRFFKKLTNKSFVHFLNEVRIRNASRLLAQEDLLVSEVCYTVGFKSITNFNNQFKLIMGNNPKNFRVGF